MIQKLSKIGFIWHLDRSRPYLGQDVAATNGSVFVNLFCLVNISQLGAVGSFYIEEAICRNITSSISR